MPEESFVSLVVIAYNEAANIARSLTAIAQLDGLGEHEIIVVDDGSSDDTGLIVADIARRNPRVQLIQLAANRGRGYARSRGVAAARGALIATVDADIILPVDWLARSRAALTHHAAVGGIAVPDGDVAYVHKRCKLTPRVVPGTATVTGNNGLYRREVFEVVSFDPALREGEDTALNYAMARQGLSSVMIPGLLVQHAENKTLVTSLKWLFDTGRGATRQLITYREVRQPDLAAVAFVGSASLGLIVGRRGHPIIGSAIPVGFVLAASVQHLRSRFQIPRSHALRAAQAVAIDSAMLTAYFAGRIAGVTALWHPRAAPQIGGRRS